MDENKDWTGNKSTAFAVLGARNYAKEDREENDFYATDPKTIVDLFRVEKFSDVIWECACGQGHLSEQIKKYGKRVISTDLIDRGYGKGGIDFLKQEGIVFNGDIITNPPYKHCLEFVLKALELVAEGRKVAMFLKIQTLEGKRRYEELFSKFPPKTIYVYVNRQKCAKNGDFEKYSKCNAICYAWYIWEKGFTDDTILRWIY